jgi:hypothetical protein
VCQLIAAQRHVDRNEDGSKPPAGKEGIKNLNPIFGHHPDSVAGADPERRERSGQAGHGALQFREGAGRRRDAQERTVTVFFRLRAQ